MLSVTVAVSYTHLDVYKRQLLELLFQAYEAVGEERKDFLKQMDEVTANMDYTESINGKKTWIIARDRVREYIPQLFVW